MTFRYILLIFMAALIKPCFFSLSKNIQVKLLFLIKYKMFAMLFSTRYRNEMGLNFR